LAGLLAAVGLLDDLAQLPRDFIHVLLGELTRLLKLLEGILLETVSRLSPTLARLSDAAELTKPHLREPPRAARLLRRLHKLGDHRQNLADDFADILRRQGSLRSDAAAIGGHRLILVLLGLGDDLRQNRSDLLQNGADVLLRELALRRPPAPPSGERTAAKRIACASISALADCPLSVSGALLALRELEQGLRQLLEVGNSLRCVLRLRILEQVLLRVIGMHHELLPSSVACAPFSLPAAISRP